ncbi:hypothetical protein PLEOSDRAFT_1067469 [Pleurotus ostreatus PC15]|uniref:Protein arginine N-methyltransferase n=1 Tax=Pleurotus ostreatus (strain PC15) TaxID=1137138 RepID=A0A067N9E0_PLEO1|nr:hypothetical protein PLEOSDRAFT_1067469 [Pleurotus ostreatus PC15]
MASWDSFVTIASYISLEDIVRPPKKDVESKHATHVLGLVADARGKGYDSVCLPLTTQKWKERWAGMCLAPERGTPGPDEERNATPSDGIAGAVEDPQIGKVAEEWRQKPAFTLDEVTVTRLDEAEGTTVMISDWLEVDGPDDWIRHDAEIALQQELAYASYLNIHTAILPPPRTRAHVASYGRIVQACLKKTPYMQLAIRLPIYNPYANGGQDVITSKGDGVSSNPGTPRLVVSDVANASVEPFQADLNETWEMWDVIRSICDYDPRLVLMLDLTPLPFPTATEALLKWNAEPVKYLFLPSSTFIANMKGYPSCGSPSSRIFCIAGAGRGPIVQRCLNAIDRSHKAASVYAVEKNPNAFVTLQSRQKNEWGDRVNLVFGDMRHIDVPEKADILVSELLGSFGDNELSPECLDGAMRFLKPSGISIPSSYTAHLAPLSSSKLFNEARSGKDEKHLETPYVVMFQAINILSGDGGGKSGMCGPKIQENVGLPLTNSHNARSAKLVYHIPQAGVIHGFAGYFEAVLYGTVGLSIHPDRKDKISKDMLSWFPLFFPLKEPMYLPNDAELHVSLWRLTDKRQVWYEWHAEAFLYLSAGPDGKRDSIGSLRSSCVSFSSYPASFFLPLISPVHTVESLKLACRSLAHSFFERNSLVSTMKSFFAAIALLSVVPGILGLMINTPVGVVQCQPILLNWQDGQTPYFLSIIPGGQPNAAALEQFPSTDATSFTWTPKEAGSVTIQLRDSTGTTAYTDIVNISGSTTPCASGSSSVAGSTGAATGAPGSSTPATSAPAATSPQSSSGASSSPASPVSGSSTGSVRPSSASVSATPSSGAAAASGSNAASRLNDGAFGLAGLLGFIGAAALL